MNAARGDLPQTKQPRDAPMKALRKQVRAVINELGGLIEELDGRWLDFGLKMPGALEKPEVVSGVVVETRGERASARELAPQRAGGALSRVETSGGRQRGFCNRADNERTECGFEHVQPRQHGAYRSDGALNAVGESLPSEPVEQVVA